MVNRFLWWLSGGVSGCCQGLLFMWWLSGTAVFVFVVVVSGECQWWLSVAVVSGGCQGLVLM